MGNKNTQVISEGNNQYSIIDADTQEVLVTWVNKNITHTVHDKTLQQYCTPAPQANPMGRDQFQNAVVNTLTGSEFDMGLLDSLLKELAWEDLEDFVNFKYDQQCTVREVVIELTEVYDEGTN